MFFLKPFCHIKLKVFNQRCSAFTCITMNCWISNENLSAFPTNRQEKVELNVQLQYHRVQKFLLSSDITLSLCISVIIVNKYSKYYTLCYAFLSCFRLSVSLSVSHKFFLRKNQVLPLSSPRFAAMHKRLYFSRVHFVFLLRSNSKNSLISEGIIHLIRKLPFLTCWIPLN